MKGKRFFTIASFAFVLSFAIMLAKPMFAQAATKNINLLVNGNFEEYDQEDYTPVGWTDPEGAWKCVEIEKWTPDVYPKEGKYFVWPQRKEGEHFYLYQDVILKEYSIEEGTWLDLNGWLANCDQSPHDEAVLKLMFFDVDGKQIKTYTRSQRNPSWKYHRITCEVPANAVTARVQISANRYVGSDNDAYFDDMYLGVLQDENAYTYVYISGNKETASAGDIIKLIANNGASAVPTQYKWSSSYDEIATVNEQGVVTFADELSSNNTNEVFIYAEDAKSGVVGVYYINSEEENEVPTPAQVKSLKASKLAKTSFTLTWTEATDASGYYVYQYNNSTKKWNKVSTISKASTKSTKITKLKSGTKYTFKVVAFKTYGPIAYEGKASKTLSVKTK